MKLTLPNPIRTLRDQPSGVNSFGRKNLIAICIALFLLGVASRLAALRIFHVDLNFSFYPAESELIAQSLAAHNRFADPYYIPPGLRPTMPLFTHLFSAWCTGFSEWGRLPSWQWL